MPRAMRTVSFKIPANVDRALDDLARRRRTSRSAVVREALEALTTPDRRGSVVALAGDLVGCAEGPGDLSTNPKYLKNFGK
jgi:Arc/MetJ-type ribon-helix-helix transcriptional regulator